MYLGNYTAVISLDGDNENTVEVTINGHDSIDEYTEEDDVYFFGLPYKEAKLLVKNNESHFFGWTLISVGSKHE